MSLKDDKQELEDFMRTGDIKADSFLEKLKASNWTAAIIGIAGASVIVLIIFAWLVG